MNKIAASITSLLAASGLAFGAVKYAQANQNTSKPASVEKADAAKVRQLEKLVAQHKTGTIIPGPNAKSLKGIDPSDEINVYTDKETGDKIFAAPGYLTIKLTNGKEATYFFDIGKDGINDAVVFDKSCWAESLDARSAAEKNATVTMAVLGYNPDKKEIDAPLSREGNPIKSVLQLVNTSLPYASFLFRNNDGTVSLYDVKDRTTGVIDDKSYQSMLNTRQRDAVENVINHILAKKGENK